MCGRYALLSNADLLAELFALTVVPTALQPRYNIAPTQDAPVVRQTRDGDRTLELMRWGLVPFWAKDPSIGNRLINARSETAASKPAFREALARRRCLVPADGFYEWKKSGARKQPHFIHDPNGRPLALAGLYERWRPSPDADPLVTYTILTTTPNAEVRTLHDRMPVIIDPGDFAAWLDRDQQDAKIASTLLRPYRDASLEIYPVSRHVNAPANDDASCVTPVEVDEPPATLF